MTEDKSQKCAQSIRVHLHNKYAVSIHTSHITYICTGVMSLLEHVYLIIIVIIQLP